MKRIKGRSNYLNQFVGPPSDRTIRIEALKQALDIRKYEIDLYWKRTAYIWTLIAVAFTGYFVIKNDNPCVFENGSISPHVMSKFVISCIGLVLSFGWYLLNRGSKYWQKNWERHVDILEDELIGPLFKTRISKENIKIYKMFHEYPFSVSKINQGLSLFITILWLGLCIAAFPFVSWSVVMRQTAVIALAALTAVFLTLLFFFARTDQQDKDIEIDMKMRTFPPEEKI